LVSPDEPQLSKNRQQKKGKMNGTNRPVVPQQKAVLRIEDLTVFRGQNCVLDNISLSILEGERIAIIGKSGAGKSSLLACIRGDLIPTEGSVIVDGKKLRYNSTALREQYLKIPIIDQGASSLVPFHSIHKSITKQLLVKGLTQYQANDVAYQYLRGMKIGDKAYSLPEELSGGERQRAVTAKSLAMGNTTRLLLSDEPTSALDPGLARDIVKLLTKTDFAIIFVTHQIELVLNEVDRILLLHNGRFHELTIVKERCPQLFMDLLEKCGSDTYYPELVKAAIRLQEQKDQERKEWRQECFGKGNYGSCHNTLSATY